MSASLTLLQSWYSQQCNGKWEFEHRISISAIDHPGWLVRIDFGQTTLGAAPYNGIQFDRGDDDWTNCAVEGETFYGAGDPSILEAILDQFHRWASPQLS